MKPLTVPILAEDLKRLTEAESELKEVKARRGAQLLFVAGLFFLAGMFFGYIVMMP